MAGAGIGREAVIASALKNFRERGYHGTSMRDIARGADMTVGSIYHHFGSKQEILQHIAVQALKDSIALTQAAVVRAGGVPAGQLRALTEAWVMFHTIRRSEAMVGATELRSVDPSGRRLVVALRDEQERVFRDVVAHGVESGAFSTTYPTDAARAILQMGQAVCNWWRDDGPLSPRELAERYAALALAMVCCEPND